MRGGELTHKLSVTPRTESASGAFVTETADTASAFAIYAKKVNLSGREVFEQDRLTGNKTHRFITYYNTALTRDCRLTWAPDGTEIELTIISVIDPNGKRRHMEITAREKD